MPVDRPAARCRPARPTNEHLQDRRCFRVGVVVRVLPLDLDDVAGIAARPVTVAAGLERRTHVGHARYRFGDLVGDHVIELPRAGELGAHECLRAFADVTLGARDFRVRRRLPRGELRVHRQMAGLAAKCRRIHVVHRALGGEQTMTMLTAVRAMTASTVRRVVGLRRSKTGQSRVASGWCRSRRASSHIPSGMSRRPSTNNPGTSDEDDQARVRVIEESKGDGNDQRDEDDGTHRRQHGAGHGQRMARQSRAASQVTCYLRLCM